jgi:hypothetical protein
MPGSRSASQAVLALGREALEAFGMADALWASPIKSTPLLCPAAALHLPLTVWCFGAVERIRNGTITGYTYDPKTASLVRAAG